MRTLVVTAWATAVIAVLVRGRPSPSTGGAALGLAVAAVMGSVAGGHAWHTEDRLVMVSSLVVHVLAVAARLGCLLVLAVHLPRASRVDAAMLQRFSSLALVCFVLVAASGTANVVSRLGPTELFGSGTYGALLVVVKVALFGLVGFLGLAHRRRTLPTLADGDSRPLWTLVAGELVVLAAVAGLGAALAGASPADGGAGDDEHAAVRI
jgi:putative copper export protein